VSRREKFISLTHKKGHMNIEGKFICDKFEKEALAKLKEGIR